MEKELIERPIISGAGERDQRGSDMTLQSEM